MQVPQLYRRGVIRPLNEAAAAELTNWRIENSIRAEWLPVLSDAHFDMIWSSGVLQRISIACGVAISDYEEVELPAAKLDAALHAIHEVPLIEHSIVSIFVQNLKAMMVEARESQKPLFFIF